MMILGRRRRGKKKKMKFLWAECSGKVFLLSAKCTMRTSLFSLIPAVVLSQSSSSCRWTSPLGGTWDLSSLQLTNDYYKTVDSRDSTILYYYNFCKNVDSFETSNKWPDPVAPPLNDKSPCSPTSLNSRVGGGSTNTPRVAWQYDINPPNLPSGANNDNCYRLGGDAANGWSFSLYGARCYGLNFS